MGQSSSRQQRGRERRWGSRPQSYLDDVDVEMGQPEMQQVERPQRTATLRRLLNHSRSLRGSRDAAQDRLLRERSGARNRFSQLFRSSDDDIDSSQVEERVEPPRSNPGTTVSRFREMLLERRTTQRTSSYLRTGQSHDSADDVFSPPRLPSMDLSSTFDDTFGGSHAEPDPPSPPAPRNESSIRRPNQMRLSARPFRNLTHSLRRRRAASPAASIRQRGGEDQAAMLSRLLSVAAAATAATLMGEEQNVLSQARSLTGSGLGETGPGAEEDGSFDGFLRALRNGRIASALRQGVAEGMGADEQSPPLNFFRMFRFGAATPPDNAQTDPRSSASAMSSESGQSEGRMVPIIIVGIRSINPNSSSGSASADGDLPPFIDALGNFPTPLPAHALGTHGHDSIDSILRPPQNGTSFRHRRRASMGGFRSRLSDRMDDQRDHRSPDRRRERPWSVASSSYEPRPPPATPASPSPELSRISSRNSTPNQSRPTSMVANSFRDFSNDSRRNSILHRSSAASPLSAHTEETASIRSTHSGTGLLGDSEPYRIHRRSDTAPNVHYPRFASGHPRRNGVVEPDNLPPLSRTASQESDESGEQRGDARSWIIYVLGGSYPENHPILTTPSLFTENPTYEDMMLLSALLGPAKAPVATEEDIESAGGLYDIAVDDSDNTDVGAEELSDTEKTVRLVARAAEGDSIDQEPDTSLEPGQRCLVCLCDFEAKEVARKLIKCHHLYHKECIDQWLTTGRNSCPLCREQGVDERKEETSTAEESPAEDRPSSPPVEAEAMAA
ncbi:hypothetical protein CLAFUW4_08141 [Fulvia fulva]|uniref:RING-type domain-containing protein n=1 Tax=Passalora fulva TaxID=5499 RepID=A0A9Q8LCJ6_PASFU|nr:uncharacterized protein CLAFUR5_08255 [Fulvia fulva]KAK4628906.1 hypothetical protein CLAFUR4_08146 [Fulvia fulva]KAK4630811.1 hypothetical protein CLAFUR0_08141 [Fulvia fulva]UJO15021.1 hypothetical protein CLAFUR5_08255 [Fulvia fulva]WPV12108.1 hypothetical protein CLAFUW4_08141 [Fulvia fulva]WPV27958.1 hypothetical protein CLAFUW7_08141 [Fulvia fulva]